MFIRLLILALGVSEVKVSCVLFCREIASLYCMKESQHAHFFSITIKGKQKKINEQKQQEKSWLETASFPAVGILILVDREKGK